MFFDIYRGPRGQMTLAGVVGARSAALLVADPEASHVSEKSPNRRSPMWADDATGKLAAVGWASALNVQFADYTSAWMGSG
jgi:hypothetical protein